MLRLSSLWTAPSGAVRLARVLGMAGAAGMIAVLALRPPPEAVADGRVLRFHHFLPEPSPQHQRIYLPWAKRIADASKGRLSIEVTAAMQLGGKPAELMAQVETGKVDIAWIVAGYTPGRFPRLEVFELPWITSSRAGPTSRALFEFHDRHAREDAASVHVLAIWCHPSGVIMSRDAPILRPGDAKGRILRVPSVVIGEAFRDMGAKPILASAPAVLKQLQQRTTDGTLFPYEVIPTLKLHTQIRHITEFAGHRGLYTSVFLLAMNRQAYASLGEAERKVLDAHSGAALSADLGRVWDEIEEAGRVAFEQAGGEVTFVKNDDYEAWVDASAPAIEAWKAKVARVGIDGARLIAAARDLVAKYTDRAYNN